jgi:F-type H+-transporting ATPase subunit a
LPATKAGGPRPARMTIDPIHQFNIEPLFTIGHIGNHTIAFTNSSFYMFLAVALISVLMIGGVARRQLVPGRFQSMAEITYEFVASTVRSTAGAEGMKFFPLIFSLFMFICVSNLVGIVPYTFTISSHIIITAALALLVFFTVLIYGLYKNGLKFFKIFVPSVPIYILPLVMFIEILTFFLRPVSHSVRLFANMLAGHIALKVFAGFVAMLGTSLGAIGWLGGMFPLSLTVALTALELLVAFLQAYVFAILTCIYLNDAIHPGH